MTPFERNLQCQSLGGGRYRFEFDGSMVGASGMFGGLTLAATVQAAVLEANDPELHVRSASTVYVSSVKPGPHAATVRVIRRGRSMAQLAVSLLDEEGKPAVDSLIIMGRDRAAFSYLDRTPPDVPNPGDCPSFFDPPLDRDAPERPIWANQPMWDCLERRVGIGNRYWEPYGDSDSSTAAMWLRYREMPRLEDGRIHPLAILSLTDMAGEAISRKSDSANQDWLLASLDHFVQWFEDTRSDWVLLVCRSGHASDGFAATDVELWDEDRNLLALASQTALINMLK